MSLENNQIGSTSLNGFKFTWTINEAENIFNIKRGKCIYSPPIIDGDNLKWIIQLYPNGHLLEVCEDYISIFMGLREKLNNSNDYSTVKMTAKIGFLKNQTEEPNSLNYLSNSATTRVFTPTDMHTMEDFSGEAYVGKCISFFHQDKLKTDLHDYIDDNGNLEIYCELFKNTNIPNLENTCNTISNPLHNEVPVCFQCSEFEKVLNSEFLSDIKLIVGDVTFLAHKIILASKSPVFMSIIEKDSMLQLIEINDISETIIKELLRYMYTGKVENIEDIGSDLLAAASKYQMRFLVKLCEDILIKAMSSTNAIEMLLTADAHDAKNLKERAIEIISQNARDLMKSKDWSKLNSNLITEILSSVLN